MNGTAIAIAALGLSLLVCGGEAKAQEQVEEEVCGAGVEAKAAGADYLAREGNGFWREVDCEAIAAFLKGGADARARGWGGETALHRAAALSRDAEVTAALLAAGAPVNARNDGGWTPLHVAAAQGNAEAAWVLLEFGAVAEAQDDWGKTPLHVAAQVGRGEVAQVLLEQGVDPDARDLQGETPCGMDRHRVLDDLGAC